MKVAWFREFGGPEVLKYEEAPDPEPEPGEALVRVRATGVNHVDLDVRAGVSRFPITFPYTLGLEYSGEVAAIRGGDGRIREGDRVWVFNRIPCGSCDYCVTGRDNLCVRGGDRGRRVPGGYAQLVTLPVSALRPLPDHVPFEDGAAAPIAFGTAWHVLINRGGLRAGETVLIQAAGSGIGSAGIQIARHAGATIITTASTDEKLARAAEMGAHHTINYAKEDFPQRGEGADRRPGSRPGDGARGRRGVHQEPGVPQEGRGHRRRGRPQRRGGALRHHPLLPQRVPPAGLQRGHPPGALESHGDGVRGHLSGSGLPGSWTCPRRPRPTGWWTPGTSSARCCWRPSLHTRFLACGSE